MSSPTAFQWSQMSRHGRMGISQLWLKHGPGLAMLQLPNWITFWIADSWTGTGTCVPCPYAHCNMNASITDADDKCQELAIILCLDLCDTPSTFVKPLGKLWSCSFTSGGITTASSPIQAMAWSLSCRGANCRLSANHR